MKKVLVVSQKDIIENPVFRQDKQLIEILDILDKNGCDVSLLYLNKEFKSDKDKESGSEYAGPVKKNYLRDMIKKDLLTENLNNFVKTEGFETIIFASYNMAQFILPRIKETISNINIIVDFRLSQLEYILQKYKEETSKKYQNLYLLDKSFKIYFFQAISVFNMSDANIFCENEYIEIDLLKKEKVKNIIAIEDICSHLKKEYKEQDYKIETICINGDNFASKVAVTKNIKKDGIHYVYFSKNSNLIDEINNIIFKSNSKFIFFYNSKLKIFPETSNALVKYLAFNDNIGVVSPVTSYAQGNTDKKLEISFEEQRNNNFASSEELHPSFFSESFMVNKTFFKKFGYFDSKFTTINFALFDFLMKLYQNEIYFFTVKDVTVFKALSVKQPLSLLKKDMEYLYKKWGELSFDFSLE